MPALPVQSSIRLALFTNSTPMLALSPNAAIVKDLCTNPAKVYDSPLLEPFVTMAAKLVILAPVKAVSPLASSSCTTKDLEWPVVIKFQTPVKLPSPSVRLNPELRTL